MERSTASPPPKLNPELGEGDLIDVEEISGRLRRLAAKRNENPKTVSQSNESKVPSELFPSLFSLLKINLTFIHSFKLFESNLTL